MRETTQAEKRGYYSSMKTKLFIAIAFSLLLGATFILLSSDSDSAKADVLLSDVPAGIKAEAKAEASVDKEGSFAKAYSCNADGQPGVDCISFDRAAEGAFTKGKVSWFSDERTASGISAKDEEGVALNLRPGTRKGWYNKKTKAWMSAAKAGNPFCAKISLKGRSAVFPIIDLGPSEYTGLAIDVSLPAVQALGYTDQSFPVRSIASARVVGRC